MQNWCQAVVHVSKLDADMFVKQQLQSLQQALKLATDVEACVHSTGVSTAKLSIVTYTKIQDFANRMKAILYQQGTL